MKLNELTIKQDVNKIARDKNLLAGTAAKIVLKKYGWNILGIGTEGAVAEHPNKNYVLKFFSANSQYCRYITDVVMKLPNNIHVPKISHQMKHLNGTTYNYICMEKLNELPLVRIDDFADEFKVLYKIGVSFGQYSFYLPDYSTTDDAVNETPDKDWFELCEMLFTKKGDAYLDLHEGNFMLRDDTLVITDPYY